ncbi:CHAT domain-containing protein [Limnoraphis robusta Tam1]|uniref:CHAT domain-containing protein n=1 Tax=Limnoraphis robusta TaxID=1118279 RepID=UPI002B2142FA|nr:CHAT domain-containing protein [Limnoraphis robusta]MEA5499183.1 CHAT domain-containing protein [Limnoraphis robusta BA-68 BA1]MEA5540696.1 CHAT domain-containing protein [Limnoraphis robusta Tam1]
MKLLQVRFYPIEGNPHRFKVTVEGSSGEAHYEPSLPFFENESSEIKDRRFTITKILELTDFKPDNFDESEQNWLINEKLLLKDKTNFKPNYLEVIGRRLYEKLGQKIQNRMETAVAEAKRSNTWLHIQFNFPEDGPKYLPLTDYPWELLHNDYGFLAHQGTTFSRYIAYGSPRPNLPPVERPNILLISSGAGDERLNLNPLSSGEKEAIIRGLQKAQEQEKVKLETLNPPTLNTLRTRLLECQNQQNPHILHFDGHGFWGKRCNEPRCRKAYKQNKTQCECGAALGHPQGYLVFEQTDGTADFVSAKELGELLGNSQRREQPNSEPGIALIVLSACRSGMSRSSESVFNGVAQNLIGQGIPAVVAMQYSIRVDAACAFSEYFYRSLGEKKPLAVALKHGQSAIGIEGNQWYRPVLYLRWQDNEGGQLFAHSEEEGSKKTEVPKSSNFSKSLTLAQQLQKESLEAELEARRQDYEGVNRKYRRETNPAEKNSLKAQLEELGEDLERIEKELNQFM